MIAGPIRGTVLSTQTWVSSVFTKGATQVESTKNLAEKLIESSERIKTLEEKLAKSELELTKYKQQSRDTNKLRLLLGLKEKSRSQDDCCRCDRSQSGQLVRTDYCRQRHT